MKKSSDDIIALVLELNRLLRRRMLRSGKGSTNFARSYALSIIKEGDRMTMKEFAKSMNISASSATAFVDRLVKAGWVKRMQDKKNRKIVHLLMTASGNKVLVKNTLEKRMFLQDILTLIPVSDRAHMQRILRSLLSALIKESSYRSR